MRSRRGLTLVELLVSITLGMILLAMGSSALVQVTRIAKRDTAQRMAHDDVAMIHRRLKASLSALYHPSQMRLEANAGADGAWGSGDEELSLFWMSSLRDRDERQMDYGPEQPYELVWNELRWRGRTSGGGSLSYALSGPRRVIEDYKYTWDGQSEQVDLSTVPQARRDRRRDLNDNDLRYVPGITSAIYQAIDMPGDRDDLAAQLRLLHPPTTQVVDCVFEWIDAGGVRVRCDAQNGVSISGASLLGTTWSSQTRHVVDGTFLDGRDHLAAGGSRRAMAERPALLRFRFTLIPTTNGGLSLDQEPQLPFSLSVATTPQLPVR